MTDRVSVSEGNRRLQCRRRGAVPQGQVARGRLRPPRLDLDTCYGQPYFVAMKRIAAAKFKEQCLALLDRVGPEGLVITKHGKPVAKLVPIESDAKGLIGALLGKLTIRGDILSTGTRWNAES